MYARVADVVHSNASKRKSMVRYDFNYTGAQHGEYEQQTKELDIEYIHWDMYELFP